MYYTKEDILNEIDDTQIIEYYTGIAVEFNKPKFKNVLRPDKTGTCYYKRNKNGRVYLIDPADREKGYDCFTLVMELYNLSFSEAISKIVEDLRLIQVSSAGEHTRSNSSQSKMINFKIVGRTYNEFDYQYWKSYGISKRTLYKYRNSVIPAKTVYKENSFGDTFRLFYEYQETNPCYVYVFKKRKIRVKIYQPLVSDKSYKWRSNSNRFDIFGFDELPATGNILIITSSMKEVMLLSDLGFDAIAPQSEGIIFDADVIRDLKERFTEIRSIFDFDTAGYKLAEQYEQVHSIKPIDIYKDKIAIYGKDLSDIVKNKHKTFITNILNDFKNGKNDNGRSNDELECSSSYGTNCEIAN